MKNIFLLTAVLLLVGGGTMHAQVRVQVNGDRSFVIDADNGLYFHNDTMTVDGNQFALGDITVITLQPALGVDPDVGAYSRVRPLPCTPNPAQDYITLQGIGTEPQQAVLYSTAGVRLLEQTVTDGSVIDISHLPEGVYILRTATPDVGAYSRVRPLPCTPTHVAKIVKQL